MARETKVGLLVSCSFLCLLGVVLFNKLNGGTNETSPTDPSSDEVTVASGSTMGSAPEAPRTALTAQEQAAAGTVQLPPNGKNNPPKVLPAEYLTPDPPPPAAAGASTVEMPPDPNALQANRGATAVPPATGAPGSSTVMLAPGTGSTTPPGQTGTNTPIGNSASGIQLPPDPGAGSAGTTRAPDTQWGQERTSQHSTAAGTAVGNIGVFLTTNPPQQVAGTTGQGAAAEPKTSFPPLATSRPGGDSKVDPPPPSAVQPQFQIRMPDPSVVSRPGTSGPETGAPSGTKIMLPEDPPPAPIPVGRLNTPSATQTPTERPSTPTAQLQMPTTLPRNDNPASVPTNPASGGTVALGPARPSSSVGETGGMAPRLPISNRPDVDSFDEARYTAQPGDTFRTIASRYYNGADKYGDALLWYNRNHPLVGEGVRQDPPTLSGQQVFIPLDRRVLEKRYPNLIPGLALQAAPPPSAGRPSVTTADYPRYRVIQKDGETMFTIAQRTLGNGYRWREISALNPQLTTEFAVEAGKVLRLPQDARVDAQNLPQ